jgi:hypothetical protein
MYSMSLALTMASTLLAVQWWNSTGRTRRFWSAFGYLLVTWLALHTHYFALYIVVAQQVALGGWAVIGRSWRKVVIWWGISLLLLLLWLPWLLAAWSILIDYRGNGDSPCLLDALVRAHRAFVVGETVPVDAQPWWATVALGAMGLGAFVLWQRVGQSGRAAAWFLLVYWLTPLAATWLSAQSRPIFNERYLVATVPPVYLLMAVAVSRYHAGGGPYWPRWLGSALVALVVVGMALALIRQYSDPRYSKTRGWRELAAALQPLSAGVDPMRVRLVQNYPDPTLWYYYRGEVPHLVLPPAPHDQLRSNAEVDRLVTEGVERVILVEQPAEAWDSAGIARDALGEAYTLVGNRMVAQWPLSLWLRPTAQLEPLQVEYEGGLRLTGVQVIPQILPAGGVAEVHLRWEGAAASLSEQEAVSLQMLNGSGELVAQTDRPLAIESVGTAPVATYAILIPDALAEGEYQVILVVYDPSREDSPRRLTLQGVDHVVLGTVSVTK